VDQAVGQANQDPETTTPTISPKVQV